VSDNNSCDALLAYLHDNGEATSAEVAKSPIAHHKQPVACSKGLLLMVLSLRLARIEIVNVGLKQSISRGKLQF